MTEPTNRLPAPDSPDQVKLNDSDRADDDMFDPQQLVYNQGTPENPGELLQNPAVAPEMVNAPGDIRSDLMED